MKNESMGHTSIADSKWGKRTLGQALKQESIAWKIHDKNFVNVSSVATMNLMLCDCLKVVLSKEATFADGRLAIKEFKRACAQLTQQGDLDRIFCDAKDLIPQPDEVEFCTCGDKRGMGRRSDGTRTND